MAKFHLNPAKGPMRCSAADGQCPYGSDAPHFASKEVAIKAYEEQLAHENSPFSAHKKEKPASPKALTPQLKTLDEKFEEADYDTIQRFANRSAASHQQLGALIDARAASGPERFAKIEDMNPYNEDARHPASYKTYKALRADLDTYRNHTAMLVEAHTQSRFYKPKSEAYPEGASVGTAHVVTKYSHDDPMWHQVRFNTVGGSDVGALAVSDFTPEGELSGYDKGVMERVVESKTVPKSKEDTESMIRMNELSRKGAIYRGTVWEGRIRDQFADDHKDLQVWHTKEQYAKDDAPWHQVNLDGLVGDKGSDKPHGILEIKTGGIPEKWQDGVPPGYRAQTLYYLNATGLDRAYVRVLLNDGESRDYVISAHDEVYPGSGVIMDEYVKNRVKPWFDELKEQRKNTA